MATEVVGNLVAEATLFMQRKIQAAEFVLTAELLNSRHHQSAIATGNCIRCSQLGFRDTIALTMWRHLLYSELPHIDVLEDYVRQVGLGKFKYITGHLLNASYRLLHIPNNQAVNRTACKITTNRMRVGVKRSRKKSFCNPTRLIYKTGYRTLKSLPSPVLRAIKEQLEQRLY